MLKPLYFVKFLLFGEIICFFSKLFIKFALELIDTNLNYPILL